MGESHNVSTVIPAGAPRRTRILVVAVVTALTIVFTLLSPQVARAATAAPTYAEMMQRVVDDTNAVRAEVGLRPLVRNALMDEVAAAWALQQWVTGVMGHNPLFSLQISAGWLRAGENVAKGYSYTQVVPAWKASPSHYANIVNDYNSIGIGFFELDGRRYWCQLFAKYPGVTQPPISQPPPPPSTPSQMPAPAPALSSSPRSPSPSPSTPTGAAEPMPPAGVSLPLSSPSFENGKGTWIAPSGYVDGPNSQARGGVRSLLVPGYAARTVTQTLGTTVAAGSSHTFTIWIRADGAAAGTVRLRTVGGASTEQSAVNFTASSLSWLKVSVSLTAASAHTGFRLEIVTPATGRMYRLDSASLVRTGQTATTAASAPPPASSVTSPAPAPVSGSPLVVNLGAPRTSTG